MEFSDPIVAQAELAATDSGSTQADRAVDQLQDEIDKAYTSVEKRFGELWSSASKNASDIQHKYQLEEHRKQLLDRLNAASRDINDRTKLTEHLRQFEDQLKLLSSQVHVPDIDVAKLTGTANGYLDSLDLKLEVVEKEAGKYVSLLTSFLSSMVTINADPAPAQPDKETLFVSTVCAASNYGTSRYDSDLFKLHTTPALILEEVADGEDAFNADDRTQEIARLLEKYDATLRKLMNELVPVKVSYNAFWCRYFRLESRLQAEQEQRKRLLDNKETSKAAASNDDEEFTWDDDDEDEEPVDVASEAQEIKNSKKTDAEDDDWE